MEWRISGVLKLLSGAIASTCEMHALRIEQSWRSDVFILQGRSNTITTLKKQFRQMATEAAAGSRYEPSCHKAAFPLLLQTQMVHLAAQRLPIETLTNFDPPPVGQQRCQRASKLNHCFRSHCSGILRGTQPVRLELIPFSRALPLLLLLQMAVQRA
ncbi:MAG TPA: hypothetical protein VK638_10220 [Edaphobacter sp.]|nr:hypothetical protein [Edaphobacter sp.]